ncbi:MAG: glycosyltransferase [Saprospiraceae bacterium]
MDLSVIIVSYNVSHFLEQTVVSSLKAMRGIDAEIIVVDNFSVDNSVDMIRSQFPQVKLICNSENYGFAKANNIGIKQAIGEFILLLNPDTVVQEDCFAKCLDFMRKDPKVGAVGVKMLDGSGNILPESKRGFPTIWASFCKMSGLYKLFPKSKFFNAYYMGHLDYNNNHEVEILTGAFFFTRKKILETLGGLDESYFMYGEDIDLSHSIRLLGYKNYYLAETQILHFKGESTKKSSLNYWSAFYSAMLIFANKYNKGNSKAYLLFLKTVIFIKGLLSFGKSILNRIVPILLDGFFIVLGIYLIKNVWSLYFYHDPYHFQSKAFWFNAFLYGVIWIFCFYINGVYDKKYRSQDLVVSSIIGFIINLSLYALIPESLRSSRMILTLTFFYILFYSIFSRYLYNLLFLKSNKIGKDIKKSILVIGTEEEKKIIESILDLNQTSYVITDRIDSSEDLEKNDWNALNSYYKFNEIVFCPSASSVQIMMMVIGQLPESVHVKLLNPSGSGIIGSTSSKLAGELYTFDFIYNLQKIKYQRQKRFFDLAFSLIVLAFSWILVFFQRDKKNFFYNIFNVIFGFKTWIGIPEDNINLVGNEIINVKGILEPLNSKQKAQGIDFAAEAYKNYLWNYSIWMDLDICLDDITQLDR